MKWRSTLRALHGQRLWWRVGGLRMPLLYGMVASLGIACDKRNYTQLFRPRQ